jgi:hypothetical protein
MTRVATTADMPCGAFDLVSMAWVFWVENKSASAGL